MDEKNEVRVVFSDAYAGGARCDVYIGKVVYVLELSDLSKRLEKEITEKGYTTEQSKRQKYPRIIINQ